MKERSGWEKNGRLRNHLSSCPDAGTQAQRAERLAQGHTVKWRLSALERQAYSQVFHSFFVPNHERPGRLGGSGQEAKQSGGHDCGMCWGNKTPSLAGPARQQAYVWPERALVICRPPLFRLVCQVQQQSGPNV